jgi:antitoxin component YwqK of YwqJK toxin-antitoxin module
MKHINIIFFLLLLLSLFACKKNCRCVKQLYDNKNEKEVRIYPDCNDTTCYLRQWFYENGKIASEGHYSNLKAEGHFKSWSESGYQTADWSILDGKETGFIQCWYDNGVKKRVAILEKGIPNGLTREWDTTGKPVDEGVYINGKKNGVWKTWFDSGSWKTKTYKKDSLWGSTHEHLVDSGKVILVNGQYENGLEVGVWKWFDKDSVLYETTVYKNGKATGEYLSYYHDGKTASSGYLVNGKFEGKVEYYDTTGKVTKIKKYKNGKEL